MNNIKVLLLKEAHEFVVGLPEGSKKKVLNIIRLVKRGYRDPKFFKKLQGTEIWEFRAEYESNAYRLLAFWDKEKRSLVVATHGFAKKDQKTPKKEIKKAEQIRQEYMNIK